MRPVNQVPLSLKEINRSPFGSSRSPDSPPKPLNFEVSTSPLRYCSEPNRTCEWSRRSKNGIGWKATSIDMGEEGKNFSRATSDWARTDVAETERPATAPTSKRRRRNKASISRSLFSSSDVQRLAGGLDFVAGSMIVIALPRRANRHPEGAIRHPERRNLNRIFKQSALRLHLQPEFDQAARVSFRGETI